jgi:hypothetical protein
MPSALLPRRSISLRSVVGYLFAHDYALPASRGASIDPQNDSE